jgi:shikimate dehydrogenase
LSPAAALIGAVNTVVVRDRRLTGYNTDTTGFARAAGPLVDASSKGAVAVIGAGGVGKAIAFALADLSVDELRIFDSEAGKAARLAARLEHRTRTHVADSVEDALHGVAGVVNASPVGMLPSLDSPVPHALLHAGLWVADAVWTPLLTAARAKGARVMTGRELAIYASANAFELFTGQVPCTTAMGIAFDDVMARRYPAPDAA